MSDNKKRNRNNNSNRRNTMKRLKRNMNSSYRNAFAGNTQNVNAYNAGRNSEINLRQMELNELLNKKKVLENHIHSQEAQDMDAITELDMVEEEIRDLQNYINKHSLRSNKNKTNKNKNKNKNKSKSIYGNKYENGMGAQWMLLQ